MEPDASFDVAAAYREHGGALYGFALNTVRDAALAEDCVQEVFVRAWRARPGYDPSRGSLRTWLFVIARSVVLDAHRARSRRPPVVGADVAADRADPAHEDVQLLERMRLNEALARLSPEHREVVVAVHVNGRDYADVSQTSGVKVATLRTRMFHALRMLRRELGEGDDGRGA